MALRQSKYGDGLWDGFESSNTVSYIGSAHCGSLGRVNVRFPSEALCHPSLTSGQGRTTNGRGEGR
jgi:hypothetical protein